MYLDDNKTAFHGFKDLTVVENINTIANPFSFQIPQKYSEEKGLLPNAPALGDVASLATGGGNEFRVQPGTKIEIFVNETAVLTGRVDRIEVQLSARNKTMLVTGRSLAADLVDCSVEAPFEYTNIGILSLAEKLVAPFEGIKIFNSVTPTKIIDKIAIKPGDTVFEVLDRVAREQGFFWLSTRAGNLRLTEGAMNEEEDEGGLSLAAATGAATSAVASALGLGSDRFRADSRIEEDINLKDGSIILDDSQRYSNYTVKGSTRGQDFYPGIISSIGEGSAEDQGITRNRPLILIAEGNVDIIAAGKRAEWEAASRLARGVQIQITVQNWLQEDSIKLWGANQLVNIKSRTLGMDGDFLSTSVQRIRSRAEGTITRISFTREDALVPKSVIPNDGAGANSLEAIVARSQSNIAAF